MCGIIGIVSARSGALRILDGLSNLEYRGYDSAGIAFVHANRHEAPFECFKALGKLDHLKESYAAATNHNPIAETHCIGIGHTRWATHGDPERLSNAHPIIGTNVMIVHNGVIDNYAPLKEQLIQKGYVFSSETDTEVVVHMIEEALRKSVAETKRPLDIHDTESLKSFHAHMLQGLHKLKGAMALVIAIAHQKALWIYRAGKPPIAIATTDEESFVASDAIGLAGLANELRYLEDGDLVMMTQGHAEWIYTHAPIKNIQNERPLQKNPFQNYHADHQGYDSFMEKEIRQQPDIIRAIATRTEEFHNIIDWKATQRITMLGCGTSYHAALLGKYFFEIYGRLRANACISSEFASTHPPVDSQWTIALSQSGETLDTLQAIEYATHHNRILAITNVPQSSITRHSVHHILLQAGAEVSVASTKCFMAQVMILLSCALDTALIKGSMSADEAKTIRECWQDATQYDYLFSQPTVNTLRRWAQRLRHANRMFVLGRDWCVPIALEAALKITEIAYIQAQGFPAGEIKHGPIALADNNFFALCFVSRYAHAEKMHNNIAELRARKAQILCISDDESESLEDTLRIIVPKAFAKRHANPSNITPWIISAHHIIAAQLLSLYLAQDRGHSVDRPKNLAKSVTVE